MIIMDCTLRDGANVVGDGFSGPLTELILDGLTENRVGIIEFGNAKGISAYEVAHATKALTDLAYLQLAQPYLQKAKVGMFQNAGRFRPEGIRLAADHGLSFVRVGAAAGDGNMARPAIEAVKDCGMEAFYAIMKAYLLSPQELAEEAAALEGFGLDEITIMDSAGTMKPEEVSEYVKTVKSAVSIPVGFHGHNNLGLAVANARAAAEAGADILDCGLLGMARSAGNIPTEVIAALLEQNGIQTGVDVFGLLDYLDERLIPVVEKQGYHAPLKPLDLVYGLSGAHSSFGKQFRTVAEETGVSLFQLIAEVSKRDRKKPDEALMRAVAKELLVNH